MPLYEYSCRSCGEKFEAIRGIMDEDKGVKCPNCGSEDLQRVLTSFYGGKSSGSFRFPT